MKLKYYYNLDGLRGIAALMVVVFHYFSFPISRDIDGIELLRKLTVFGQYGVSLFFVLSGFVITRILLNTKNQEGYFSSFYAKRLLRIAPLYYLFLILWYYVLPFVSEIKSVDIGLQLPHLLYFQNFNTIIDFETYGPGHFWSLAVEEHFYFLWPLLVYFIKDKHLGKLIVVSILIVFIIRYFCVANGIDGDKFTFTRIDQIILGAYIALLERNGKLENRAKMMKHVYLIGVLSLMLTGILFVFQNHFAFFFKMVKHPAIGIFFAAVITFLILSPQHFLSRLLSTSVFQYLGKISYGIYVWHLMIIIIMTSNYTTKIWYIDLSILIAATIIVSHISFNYFEKYFLKFKNKIGKKKQEILIS